MVEDQFQENEIQLEDQNLESESTPVEAQDPPYRKKVYDLLSQNFSDFKRTEDEFYNKLDTDPEYYGKVHDVLSNKFSDFKRPKDEFGQLLGVKKNTTSTSPSGVSSSPSIQSPSSGDTQSPSQPATPELIHILTDRAERKNYNRDVVKEGSGADLYLSMAPGYVPRKTQGKDYVDLDKQIEGLGFSPAKMDEIFGDDYELLNEEDVKKIYNRYQTNPLDAQRDLAAKRWQRVSEQMDLNDIQRKELYDLTHSRFQDREGNPLSTFRDLIEYGKYAHGKLVEFTARNAPARKYVLENFKRDFVGGFSVFLKDKDFVSNSKNLPFDLALAEAEIFNPDYAKKIREYQAIDTKGNLAAQDQKERMLGAFEMRGLEMIGSALKLYSEGESTNINALVEWYKKNGARAQQLSEQFKNDPILESHNDLVSQYEEWNRTSGKRFQELGDKFSKLDPANVKGSDMAGNDPNIVLYNIGGSTVAVDKKESEEYSALLKENNEWQRKISASLSRVPSGELAELTKLVGEQNSLSGASKTMASIDGWMKYIQDKKNKLYTKYPTLLKDDMIKAEVAYRGPDYNEGLKIVMSTGAIAQGLQDNATVLYNYLFKSPEEQLLNQMEITGRSETDKMMYLSNKQGEDLFEGPVTFVYSDNIKKRLEAVSGLSGREKVIAERGIIQDGVKKGEIYQATNPNYGNININAMSVWNTFSTVAPQLGVAIGATVATGGGAASLFLSTAAIAYSDFYKEGVKMGLSNPGSYATAHTLVEAAIEMLGTSNLKIIKRAFAGKTGYGAAFFRDLSESEFKALSAGRRGSFTWPATKQGLRPLLEEGFEEAVADPAHNLTDNLMFGQDKKVIDLKQMRNSAVTIGVGMLPLSILGIPMAARRINIAQKFGIFNASTDLDNTLKVLREEYETGKMNKDDYDGRVKLVMDYNTAIRQTPSTYSDGRPMRDEDRATYAFNNFIINKAKEKANLSTKQQAQVDEASVKAQIENDRLLQNPDVKAKEVEPGKRLFNDPNPEAAAVEEEYKKKAGITAAEPARITVLDEERSKRIADAYDDLLDSPDDPEVQRAYQAMADETVEQFKSIEGTGVKVELWTGKGEPYKNSAEMIADVRNNKHMYIFPTEEGFGDSPITDKQRQQNALLRDSGIKDVNGRTLLVNDIFRFVHDYFGHTRLGNSFGAIGEENAWNVHARMYSPLARRAMTTETRGQNSWVNFNKSFRNADGSMKKKGDEGYLPPAQRPFADQKMALLPIEFSEIENSYSLERVDMANATKQVEMIKQAQPGAGVTMNIDGSVYTGGGLVVPAASVNTTVEDVTPEMIDKFVEDNRGKIEGGKYKIGLYRFPDSNAVSIDLSIVIPSENREAAVRFAALAGQESIFDLDTLENIKTGSTGNNPVRFTDKQFRDIAFALSQNKVPAFVEKAGIDAAIRNTIDTVSMSLKASGIKFQVVDGSRDAQGAAAARGNQALFISEDGTVIIDSSKIADQFEAGIVVWHEAAHPVMNIINNTNKSLYDSISRGLAEVAKTNSGVLGALEWAMDNYSKEKLEQRLGREVSEEEAEATILSEAGVETIARINAGIIDISTIESGFRQKLIDFVNRIAKFFGIDPILNDTDIVAFKKTISQVADALKTGRDIGEVVGRENVGKFQVDTKSAFTNKGVQARFSTEFFEDSNSFNKLVEDGYVVHNSNLSNFDGDTVVIHNPDSFATGKIKFRDKDLVEGEGGIYFTLKFGDVWASSKEGTAKQMANLINESFKRSGKARVVLVKGDSNKNLTSVKGAKALMGVLEILSDDGLIPLSAFRRALNAAGKKYGVNFDGRADAKSIHKDIRAKFMNVSNSSFERRGDFVRDVIDEIAKQDVLSKDDISKIADSIGAKRKMTTFSKASIIDSVAHATTERILLDVPNSHAYAVIEADSPVEIKRDGRHESYPWHIVTKNGSRPKLYLLKERPFFNDVFVAAKDTEKVKSGERFGDVSRAGLAQRGMGLAKVEYGAQASVGNRDIINGFYSPIEDRINTFKQPKASVQKWKEIVGMKSDEAVFSGMADWLGGMKPDRQLSKEEVLKFMKDNRIEIKEVEKGAANEIIKKQDVLRDITANGEYRFNDGEIVIDMDPEGEQYGVGIEPYDYAYYDTIEEAVDYANRKLESGEVGVTKYQNYQLPGGENYKEVLITLPFKKSKSLPDGFYAERSRDGVYRVYDNEDTLVGQGKTEAEAINDALNEPETAASPVFKSSHFDEPNIITHLRMNTRTDADGKKVLFLEEIQSDWGQKGKREGFKRNINEREQQQIASLEDRKQSILKGLKSYQLLKSLAGEELAKIDGMREEDKVLGFLDDIEGSISSRIDNPYYDSSSKLMVDRGRRVIVDEVKDKINYWNGHSDGSNLALSDSDILSIIDAYNEDAKAGRVKKIKGYASNRKVLSSLDEVDNINNRIWEINNEATKGSTASAPYVTNTNAWVKLGLKVALKEAVRQGADRIAWSTGDQQFDRWGSEEIHWNTLLKPKGFDIVVKDPAKAPIVRGSRTTTLGFYDGSKNPQAELKRNAEKWGLSEDDIEVQAARGRWSLAINEQTDAQAFTGNEEQLRNSRLEESDIVVNNKKELRDAIGRNLGRERSEYELDKLADRVWGRMQTEDSGSSMPRREGMQAFYGDTQNTGIVGNVAKALVRELTGKEGSTVESVINTGGKLPNEMTVAEIQAAGGVDAVKASNANSIQPAIEITPELREAVQGGMPQFSVGNRNLAPNGKPSNLTPAQYEQVRTPQFKNWFGDWENDPANASKVVDENGEPLVVYHGTKDRFDTFSKGDFYYHFGTKRAAEERAEIKYGDGKPIVFGVFLNIRNFIPTWDLGWWLDSTKWENLLSYRPKNTAEAIYDAIKKDGYDGVLYQNETEDYRSDSWIAFEPTQIKSATDNTGEFNPNDNRIQASVGNRFEYRREFRLAAFAMRQKADGVPDTETIDSILSIAPDLSRADVQKIVDDPDQYIRDNFSTLSPQMQDNLIARAKLATIYRGPGNSFSPAFSGFEVPMSLVEHYNKLNRASDNRASRVFNKIRAAMKSGFDPARGLPEWTLAVRENAIGGKNLEIEAAGRLLRRLSRVAKEIGFTDWDAFSKALKVANRPVLTIMSNQTAMAPFNPYRAAAGAPFNLTNLPSVIPPEILALPVEIRPFVVRMRNQIDALTTDLISMGYVTSDQAVNLEKNIGEYVNRAYRLYNEKDYGVAKISEEVYNKAHKFLADLRFKQLKEQYTVNNPNTSVSFPMNNVPPIPVKTDAELMKEALEMATKEINDILDVKKNPYFGNKSEDRRDTGILKTRQNIPQPIRELMGEYTDPGIVFMMTIAKQAALKSSSEYLTKLREVGMGTLFFEKNDPKRPIGTREFASSGSESLSPLNGLYAREEVIEALQSIDTSYNKVVGAWMKLVSANRWMKTVGSYVTQAKNFESNFGFAVMNGMLFSGENINAFKESVRYSLGQPIFSMSRFSARDIDEITEKVISLNLVGQSVNMGSLRKMLGSGDVNDIALDLALNPDSKWNKAKKIAKSPIGFANKTYKLGDDFWKVYAYVNERELFADALYDLGYKDLTPEQQKEVDNRAAERVKSTWPTYDRVWQAAKVLSESAPIFGNFISFQAESARVLANSIKIARQDLKDPNEKIRKMGVRRFGGIVSYATIRVVTTTLLAISAGTVTAGLIGLVWGSDEERRKKNAINSALPAFMRTGDLWISRDSKEPWKFTVYNLSSIDPYGLIPNALNAFTEGREGVYGSSMSPGLGAAFTEVLSPLIEAEMTFGSLWSINNNVNPRTGRKVWLDGDQPSDAFSKIIKAAAENLKPSAYSSIEKLIERDNKVAELFAVFGLRPYEVDLHKSFSVALSRANKDFEEAKQYYDGLKYSPKATEKEVAQADIDRNIYYKGIEDRLNQLYRDYILMGASENKLNELIGERPSGRATFFNKERKANIRSN